MNKEILENNKLIARFMNIEFVVFEWSNYKTLIYGNEDSLMDFEDIRYYNPNSDWNELMAVVEKIERLEESWDVDIYRNSCEISVSLKFNIDDIIFTGNTKIEATYKTVIGFIKWYNDNKK